MPLSTPGTYLRRAREAAGLGLEDVALFTETTPPVSAHRRAEWLRDIEADAAPVPPGLAATLAPFLHLDQNELDELIAAHTDAAVWRAAGPRVVDAQPLAGRAAA